MPFRKVAVGLITLATITGHSAVVRAEASVEQMKEIRVSSTLPLRRDIDYVLEALGSVESLSSPTISAETAGRITQIAIDVGSPVAQGQLLVSIDSTLHDIQVAESEAEFQRQEVMLENQRREVDRLNRLAKSQSVSKDQLEDQRDQLAMLEAQIEVARQRMEHARYMASLTQVLAPQASAIAKRHVSLGDYVSPGQPLFDLVSVDRLRARLAFPEQDASSIKLGQEVYLNTPAAPDVMAIGTVTQINPRININNRAVEVLVEFSNPGGWYPGGSVNATLVFDQRPAALTVPRQSVVNRNGQAVVFVTSGGRARAQPVELGWREPEWIEITRGLEESDRVVVEGASLITDGSALREGEPTP